MSKIKSTSDESQRLSDLLASKEQVEHLIKYYTSQYDIYQKLYNTIQHKITLGYIETKGYWFGFIPITKRIILDEQGIKQFQKELIDIVNKQLKNQKHLQFYLDKKTTIDTETDRITTECNQHFDAVLAKAKTISNPRLVASINDYKTREATIDPIEKIAFYKYLKQEINNSLVHGKK